MSSIKWTKSFFKKYPNGILEILMENESESFQIGGLDILDSLEKGEYGDNFRVLQAYSERYTFNPLEVVSPILEQLQSALLEQYLEWRKNTPPTGNQSEYSKYDEEEKLASLKDDSKNVSEFLLNSYIDRLADVDVYNLPIEELIPIDLTELKFD